MHDKPLAIGHQILLDTNSKSYMSSSAVLLDLTLNDIEGQNQDRINFSPLYLVKGQSFRLCFLETVASAS